MGHDGIAGGSGQTGARVPRLPYGLDGHTTDADGEFGSVGGPAIAAETIRAGLVDEYHLFVTPVVVGGGTPVFPEGVRSDLDPAGQCRFTGGVVYLRYRTRG
jgi:dihydrofolate reductase